MDESMGHVLYVVRTWVPEDRLQEWNEWHKNVHVPDVAAQPGVIRATRYRVLQDNTPTEWQAQFMTVYEFASEEDWQSYNTSEQAARLRKDYADRYGSIGRISRLVLLQADVEAGEID